jgi:hypothetical protein
MSDRTDDNARKLALSIATAAMDDALTTAISAGTSQQSVCSYLFGLAYVLLRRSGLPHSLIVHTIGEADEKYRLAMGDDPAPSTPGNGTVH